MTPRVLILDDNPDDAKLLARAVQHAFPAADVHTTATEAEYQRGLAWHPDIVLADLALPDFTGVDALRLLQLASPTVPFLVVTGIFEEDALASLCAGVAGYLLKDNLQRLGSAMQNALEQRDLRVVAAEAATRQAFQARLLDTVGQAVIATDATGGITYWNSAAEALYGWTAAEAVGRPLNQISPRLNSKDEAAASTAALLSGETWTGEFLVQRRDGVAFPALVTDTPIRDSGGHVIGSIGVSVDISERTYAEEQYRTLFETMAQGVIYQDATGQLTSANPAAEGMLGLSLAQLQGRTSVDPHWRAIHEDGSPFPREDYPAMIALRTGRPVHGVLMGVAGPEEDPARWLRVFATPQFRPGETQPFQVFTTFNDITESRIYQEQLRHQALHDPLTGLPNRVLFADRLAHALASSGRRGHEVAVLFLDLDHFKQVNDKLGHLLGDALLIQVAQRLQSCLRSEDTLVRVGGDEFVVLLEQVRRPSEATRAAARLIASLVAPFKLGNTDLHVSASIGIALHGGATASPDELLREADIAMYQAKASGRGRYAVFHSENHLSVDQLTLERDLRYARARGELTLHYQPYVNLVTGTVDGVEALLRWQHPSRGWVSPATFIPLAEETGLILPLGTWVLEQACRTAASWQHLRPDGQPVVVAVNLSAREFDAPDLVTRITGCLHKTGLPARSLRIEITESATMRDVGATQRTLEELKALGVRLAIDDFGTGYASLSYLTRFPVDTLKVDQSFVAGLGLSASAEAITRTVTTLAHALNMDVTAEGIETPEQLRHVRALHCERGQGFYFSRAVPAAAVPALLDAHHFLPRLQTSPVQGQRQKTHVLAA